MSEHSRYVIRPHEIEAYFPANHTGPRNQRLVGPRVNGYFFVTMMKSV